MKSSKVVHETFDYLNFSYEVTILDDEIINLIPAPDQGCGPWLVLDGATLHYERNVRGSH